MSAVRTTSAAPAGSVPARLRPAALLLGSLAAVTLALVAWLADSHLGASILLTGAFVALVAILAFPVAVLIVAVPGVFGFWRVGIGATDLSVADALLVPAVIVAVLTVDWRRRSLRQALWVIAAYQLCTLFSLVPHPAGYSAAEWLHRSVLLAGGVLVGATLTQLGRAEYALKALAVVAAAIGAAAAVQAVATGFEPAYPFGLQKNGAGGILMLIALVTYAAPGMFRLSRAKLLVARTSILVGLVATQSRGAMVAFAVGIIFLAARKRREVLRSPLPAMACLLMLTFVLTTLIAPRPDDTPEMFTSLGSRALQRREAVDVWVRSPVVGQGIRYFTDEKFEATFQPHGVIFETLAESGVIGITGLLVLFLGSVAVLRRTAGPLALAATVVIVAKFAHGITDVFWSAGPNTLPWLIVGMAVGWPKREQRDSARETAGAAQPS